jgi:hypothetical protein
MTTTEVLRLPTKWLIVPSVIVLVVGGLFGIAVVHDGGFINVHGAGGLLLLLFAFTALTTGALEVIFVGISLRSMFQSPQLRTTANSVALLIGTIPIIAGCWILQKLRDM